MTVYLTSRLLTHHAHSRCQVTNNNTVLPAAVTARKRTHATVISQGSVYTRAGKGAHKELKISLTGSLAASTGRSRLPMSRSSSVQNGSSCKFTRPSALGNCYDNTAPASTQRPPHCLGTNSCCNNTAPASTQVSTLPRHLRLLPATLQHCSMAIAALVFSNCNETLYVPTQHGWALVTE